MKKILKYFTFMVAFSIITVGFSDQVDAITTQSGITCDENSMYRGYPCRTLKDGTVIVATGSGESENYVSVSSLNYNYADDVLLRNYEIVVRKYKGSGDVNDGANYEWVGDASSGADRIIYYPHRDGDGNPLYCLDADSSGLRNLYARRFLVNDDDSAGPTSVNAFDTALMSILVNGERDDMYSDEYMAASIAIRCIVATWGYVQTGSSDIWETYLGQAYGWIENYNEAKTAYNTLAEELNLNTLSNLEKYKMYSFQPSYRSGSASDRGITIIAEARQLYINALRDAADYVSSTGQATIESSSVAGQVIKEEDSIGVSATVEVKYTITLNNFTNDGNAYFSIDDLKYDEELSVLGANQQPSIKSIVINGQQYNNYQLGNNLLQSLVNTNSITDKITIEVTLEFTGYETVNSAYQNRYDNLKCGQQPMMYTLDYSYLDTSMGGKYSNYIGVLWSATKSSTKDVFQRFLSIHELEDSSDDKKTGQIEGTIQLIDACNCDDLIEACKVEAENTGHMNGQACRELLDANCGECAELEVLCDVLGNEEACRQYNAVCDVSCGTTVSTFNCCDAENHLIISPLDNQEVTVTGPENVVACFVDQIDNQVQLEGEGVGAQDIEGAKDDVGNSYTLQNNKYCTVSCKEDYIMRMPTAKLVNAGRYFTFNAAVEGTKTCYTNTIDEELFREDLEEAEEAVLEAYNAYLRAVAYQTGVNNGTTRLSISGRTTYTYYYTGTCSGNSCSRCGSSTSERCDSEGENCTTVTTCDYCSWSCTKSTSRSFSNAGSLTPLNYYRFTVPSYIQYTSTDSSVARTISSSTSYYGVNGVSTSPSSSWSTSVSGRWSASSYYTYSLSYSSDINVDSYGKSSNAYSLTSASVFNTIVNDTRAVWQAAEDHLQDLIDSYNDCSTWDNNMNYDQNNLTYDYEEDYLNILSPSIGKMEALNYSERDNATSWYCSGDLFGNNYDRCTNGTVTSSVNYYPSSSDLSQVFTCSDGKCSLEYRDISSANYVKKTSTVSATYRPLTLFYNVYPSGEIINENQAQNRDDAVAVENGLPISLSTERGIYKYTVNIDNLGEYYDRNGEPGRLIGGDNAVINQEKYGEFVDDSGSVQYACSYLVNTGITEDDTVICDFDTKCTGEDCFAGCLGPNCEYECDGDNCIAACIGAGCIYDADAGSSLIERVVSLNNLFPNGTNSYNWNRDLNRKAEETIEEIEEIKDNVYLDEPILSVTITPGIANAIRDYNDDAEENGGYSNQTLSCYALDGYQEVACYSDFISGLLAGEIRDGNTVYGDHLDIVNNRSLIMSNNYRTVRDDNFEYFTLWDGSISEETMIGPAWK